LGAIACFWLIALTQVDDGTFFETKTIANNTDEFSCKSSDSNAKYSLAATRSNNAYTDYRETAPSSVAGIHGTSTMYTGLIQTNEVSPTPVIKSSYTGTVDHDRSAIPSPSVDSNFSGIGVSSGIGVFSGIGVIPTPSVKSAGQLKSSPPVSELSDSRSKELSSSLSWYTTRQVALPVPPVFTEAISPTPSAPVPAFRPSSAIVQSSSVPTSFHSPTPRSTSKERDERNDQEKVTSIEYRVSDELSYALVQLVLPLAILIRWWMPREGLSHEDFSSLLQFALATAFDLAEFSHLLVDLPELHNHRTLVILVLLFSSTSLLLLVQLDIGLGSQSPRDEAIWVILTILFLDGPFFAVRVYIMVRLDAEVEKFQLVFLLKNVFAILFGIYRILALWSQRKETKKDEYPGTEDPGEVFVNVGAEGAGLRNGQENMSSLQPEARDSLNGKSVVISNEAVMHPMTTYNGDINFPIDPVATSIN
jgi:hypothetical protein